MAVFFTSDLHLGHMAACKFRQDFCGGEQKVHDRTIVENINEKVYKKDKLFILGDLALSREGLVWASTIRCQNIELILGNHDNYKISEYLNLGLYGSQVWKAHGFKKYKEMWLSHCPIHPNEMYRAKGNIHGHVHKDSNSEKIKDPRYINVNIDMNEYYPVSFEEIRERLQL